MPVLTVALGDLETEVKKIERSSARIIQMFMVGDGAVVIVTENRKSGRETRG